MLFRSPDCNAHGSRPRTLTPKTAPRTKAPPIRKPIFRRARARRALYRTVYRFPPSTTCVPTLRSKTAVCRYLPQPAPLATRFLPQATDIVRRPSRKTTIARRTYSLRRIFRFWRLLYSTDQTRRLKTVFLYRRRPRTTASAARGSARTHPLLISAVPQKLCCVIFPPYSQPDPPFAFYEHRIQTFCDYRR